MGQAIVERANQTLKQYFQKNKKGEFIFSPATQLSTILFILNFLTVDAEARSPMERHTQNRAQSLRWVHWKDLQIEIWMEPNPLLAKVRGMYVIFLQELVNQFECQSGV